MHGVQLFPSCILGKCSSSRSPWVKDMSHQIRPNASHDPRNAIENTIRVHLHCASTKVVNKSWRNRSLFLFSILDWIMLQSPFLKMARLRSFLLVLLRKVLLKIKMKKHVYNSVELIHINITNISQNCWIEIEEYNSWPNTNEFSMNLHHLRLNYELKKYSI